MTERKRAEEALRESENRLRMIFDSVQAGILIIDPETHTIVDLNPAAAQLIGAPREKIAGSICHQHICPAEIGKCPITDLKQNIENKERTLFTARGETRPIIKTVVPITMGGRKYLLETFIDITERKQAEEALRKSEERYRTILENMEDGYFEIDLAGNLTFFNNSLRKFLGYSNEETMGMNYRQFVDKGALHRVSRVYRSVYVTGIPLRAFDYKIIREDGTARFIESGVSLIRNEKGEPIGFRGVARDITDRKQAEEALRQSEERYRTLVEESFDGIFIQKGPKIIFANQRLYEMLGYDEGELLEKDHWLVYHPDYHELTRERARARMLGENAPPQYEVKLQRKDGSSFDGEINARRIMFGNEAGIQVWVRDITKRKRAEEEMRALEEQLRQSQKMEAVGRLAGGIAHDFNNLLTVIKGYSQLSLLDLKETDPLWVNMQEIQKVTQRASDLTRQLLAFSRRQILDPKVLDLNSLLRDLDKMLRRIIGEDIELSSEFTNDLGRVKIDPGQFEQMILNLAVNAKDAMPSGGRLSIETTNVQLDEEDVSNRVGVTPGRYVRLSISDNGVGMSKEVKEKMFEPFFTTKEKGKGTGLGLSTVYGIVKQSGGNIRAESEPGHGTTFEIYLPRIEEALDTLCVRDETDSLPGGSETVLLVEDEQEVRSLAHRLLCQQGYRVLAAANGVEALHIAQEHTGENIDLLLTDVVMPQMSGKELSDQLKTFRPDVKILYTSGYTDDDIVHHGVLDPGTHFLQKPFTHQGLSRKVREVLDRSIK